MKIPKGFKSALVNSELMSNRYFVARELGADCLSFASGKSFVHRKAVCTRKAMFPKDVLVGDSFDSALQIFQIVVKDRRNGFVRESQITLPQM